MKAALLRALLFCTGLALVMWAALPAGMTPAGAAPRFAVTETPPTEPPTLTPSATPPPTSTPTGTPIPTPTPTATEIGPAPSLTPVTPSETPTPPPTDTPPPEEPPPSRRDTATPTASPTTAVEQATAELPTATPVGGSGGPVADPSIEKSVSPSRAVVGQRVVYTIAVTNLGPGPAAGVRVSDTLPSFVRPNEVSTTRGQASLSGQSVEVLIGDLAPGETVTITITATVVAPAPGNNRNLATVTSDTPDANLDNNQSSVPLETDAPTSLPNTGDEGPGGAPVAVLLLGLALIAASMVVTRGAAGARPRE